LLVIFEAYPEHQSRRSFVIKNGDGSASAQRTAASELYAYTQPIVKAIKKFRRDVSIADACGAKCADTKVEYAFADTVNEAALLTRWFGERAEEADETGGLLWREREWLAVDFCEVMNLFSLMICRLLKTILVPRDRKKKITCQG